jgi:hypothetical protein
VDTFYRREITEQSSAHVSWWRPDCVAGSGDERSVLLVFGFVRRARRGRQLEHRRVLAFAQPGEQHGLPVRELQRFVMHVRLAHVDLPEQRYFLLSSELLTGFVIAWDR